MPEHTAEIDATCVNCGEPIIRVTAWTDHPYWAHARSETTYPPKRTSCTRPNVIPPEGTDDA
jgi:hypothetical protein